MFYAYLYQYFTLEFLEPLHWLADPFSSCTLLLLLALPLLATPKGCGTGSLSLLWRKFAELLYQLDATASAVREHFASGGEVGIGRLLFLSVQPLDLCLEPDLFLELGAYNPLSYPPLFSASSI